jgi:hypothetical protein
MKSQERLLFAPAMVKADDKKGEEVDKKLGVKWRQVLP